VSALDDESILRELVERAGAEGRFELLQYRSLVSGRQYAPVFSRFRAAVPPGARVLDWGAGNGHFSFFLARAGYAVTAYAFSPPALLAEPASGGVRVVRADPGEPVKLPFPDGAFDAVCSIGVLEHVHEAGGEEAASLREIARVLAPGGVFFCCHLPQRTSWVEWLARRAAASGGASVHHHSRRFSASEAARVLRAAGLAPERPEPYGFLPRNELARAPRLARSPAFAALWDGLDAILAWALPWLCTNLLVVARRPAA
jgi:SAM-dependent methyltransferase